MKLERTHLAPLPRWSRGKKHRRHRIGSRPLCLRYLDTTAELLERIATPSRTPSRSRPLTAGRTVTGTPAGVIGAWPQHEFDLPPDRHGDPGSSPRRPRRPRKKGEILLLSELDSHRRSPEAGVTVIGGPREGGRGHPIPNGSRENPDIKYRILRPGPKRVHTLDAVINSPESRIPWARYRVRSARDVMDDERRCSQDIAAAVVVKWGRRPTIRIASRERRDTYTCNPATPP